MSSATSLTITSNSAEETLELGTRLGRQLKGGEVIELIGDLGAGKTAFVRGLGRGINSHDQVQSPSFTISRLYHGSGGREIHHYDFHRLDDPGLLKQELAESLNHPQSSVAVEWSVVVRDILPQDRLRVEISADGENTRLLKFQAGPKHSSLLKGLGK